MASRANKPDTPADIEIRACIDAKRSFVMTSGAGSGKTTSLIKALEYISDNYGILLKKNKQHVACITYTNIAEHEIISDTKNNPLFHVSTIHSFLWQVIKPFKEDIREWLIFRVEEKLAKLNETRANFSSRVQQRTREKNLAEIEYYEKVKNSIGIIQSFTYEISSRYLEGKLGHDDIIKLGTWLIERKPLLRQIIAYRYPFFFIDESQDTFASIVESMTLVKDAAPMMIGYFGDPVQQIYSTGVGKIPLGDDWLEISKEENFRSSKAVLDAINCIRSQADRLEQKFHSDDTNGSVFFFISNPTQQNRSTTLETIRNLLAEKTNDALWQDLPDSGSVKILVIVHRIAAQRLGFSELFSTFNDNTPESLKNGFAEGEHWLLRPFLNLLAPMILMWRRQDHHGLISLLRQNSPRLTKTTLKLKANPEEILPELRRTIEALYALFESTSGKAVKDVLTFAHSQKLIRLDDRIQEVLGGNFSSDEDIALSIENYLKVPSHELINYYKYIENESAYSTQHGIKGAEFDRVLVILDDEEGKDYTLYSYEKLLGLKELSKTDTEHINANEESVLDRTRRLFYVCCSRARHDLGIILFTEKTEEAYRATLQSKIVTTDNIIII